MSNETLAFPIKEEMADAIEGSAILQGAKDAVTVAKGYTLIPQTSDLYLELCTLAQNITIGGQDVDSAIQNFKTNAEAILNG